MMRSPKASSHGHSISNSIIFALLGVLLTYGAFSNAVVLDAASKSYVLEIVKYQNIAITACVAFALFETLLHKKPHDKHKK